MQRMRTKRGQRGEQNKEDMGKRQRVERQSSCESIVYRRCRKWKLFECSLLIFLLFVEYILSSCLFHNHHHIFQKYKQFSFEYFQS